MADNDTGEVEVTAGPAGGTVRAKGYRLMDMVCLGGFIMMMATTYLVWEHKAQAGEGEKATAAILKESNKAFADAIKETTRDTNAVIKEMAQEQRRMTEVIRESNCLLALPQDRRNANAAEICRRLARDR